MFSLVLFKWVISFLVLSREFVLVIRKSCFSESVAPKEPAMYEEILSDLHVLSLSGLSEEVFRNFTKTGPYSSL